MEEKIRHYSTGCAFNIEELLMNFPYKKLKITCYECKTITGDYHRNILVRRVFMENFKMVLNDIIENNITFWLPLTGNKRCNIHMRRVLGEDFKNLRKGGKWKDIDIVKSMFTGYNIGFFMLGNRTPRVKSIYLNKQLRERISSHTNSGKLYGDSKNDRTVKDYLELMYLIFPSIDKSDINKILVFSWKSIYLHNSYGGDTFLSDKDIWCYIGNLRKDSLDHFHYYIRKLTIKLRVLYKRKKIEWDGYYYFALSNKQYEAYFKLKNNRGRPRKYFNFGLVCLYKILDECKINEYYKRYIFRIPYISPLNSKVFNYNLVSELAELVIIRDPLKFKDILIYENEYDFL